MIMAHIKKYWILYCSVFVAAIVMISGYSYQNYYERVDRKKFPPIGKLYEVNGSNMHIQCEGHGSPTVIFESGLGSDLSSWEDVFYDISQFTRTCRYDRKGYGHSEYGSHKKSLDQQAKNFFDLLRKANINGPKILVGYSAGGLYIQKYHRLDSKIVGMVLVDSSATILEEEKKQFFPQPWNLNRLFRKILKFSAPFGGTRLCYSMKNFFGGDGNKCVSAPPKDIYPKLKASFFSSYFLKALHDDDKIYVKALTAKQEKLGDTPTIVISRGRDFMNQGLPKSEFDRAWREWQSQLLDLSSESYQIIAKNSGHMILTDEPEVVIEAIKSLWLKSQ